MDDESGWWRSRASAKGLAETDAHAAGQPAAAISELVPRRIPGGRKFAAMVFKAWAAADQFSQPAGQGQSRPVEAFGFSRPVGGGTVRGRETETFNKRRRRDGKRRVRVQEAYS